MNKPEHIQGSYTVMKVSSRESVDKRKYLRLELENAFEHLEANYWEKKEDNPLRPFEKEPIYIEGLRKRIGSKNIVELQQAEFHFPFDREALTSIPYSKVPFPDDLHQFIGMADTLSIKPLRQFVYNAFHSTQHFLLFCTLPASKNHHHAYEGGLLRHSLECARFIEHCPNINRTNRELGIVCCLLHDVGKTLTLTTHATTPVGHLVDHEAITLEVLSCALHYLDHTWPDGSIALRHLWTHRNSRRWGHESKMPITHLIQLIDRYSAQNDVHEKLFSDVESWRNSVVHPTSNEHFWRPLLPDDAQPEPTEPGDNGGNHGD